MAPRLSRRAAPHRGRTLADFAANPHRGGKTRTMFSGGTLLSPRAPSERPVVKRIGLQCMGASVATLRLQATSPGTGGHDGEVFCCAFTPDGSALLSGGWDGYLRLWSAADGGVLSHLQASAKPVSACTVSPDGKQWLAGSLDGLLTTWDGESHKRISMFVPSGRPLAAVVFGNDPKTMATASWDRNLIVWTFL